MVIVASYNSSDARSCNSTHPLREGVMSSNSNSQVRPKSANPLISSCNSPATHFELLQELRPLW
jgi:hypothetical protein